MKHKLIKIQMTIREAQRILRILYERLNPDDADLVAEIEAALDDAAISEDPTIDE